MHEWVAPHYAAGTDTDASTVAGTDTMTLRQKIILFAITPLILALCALALAVRHQAVTLAQQEKTAVETAYLASKEGELRHYVSLGRRSIAQLYDADWQDAESQEQAKAILANLDYGDDGYFFIYDMNGVNLMHPRQPDLVGRNLWDLRDADGNYTIRKLISRARAGGGIERYLWRKPSTGKVVAKLGYVVLLPRWGWVLGTGLYMDDVDRVLAKIDAQTSNNIHNTMLWIAAIAVTAVLFIAFAGLVLNVSEYRVADAKLKVLAQRVVRSQEDERARLSRDLHDGISQLLVSIRLQVESGIAKVSMQPAQAEASRISLDRAASQLNTVLGEVRRMSHDLRPALLDDLGLGAALSHLGTEFSELTGVQATFSASGDADALSETAKTVLFRIAQEALTNVRRHAGATTVRLELAGNTAGVRLSVIDDGVGFDTAVVAEHPKRGIGLRNMHERVEAVGGTLNVLSSSSGTTVTAKLPAS